MQDTQTAGASLPKRTGRGLQAVAAVAVLGACTPGERLPSLVGLGPQTVKMGAGDGVWSRLGPEQQAEGTAAVARGKRTVGASLPAMQPEAQGVVSRRQVRRLMVAAVVEIDSARHTIVGTQTQMCATVST